MASLKDVIGGLQIVAKYVGEDAHDVDAEHDIIYAGPELTEDKVSEEDLVNLDMLGWFWDDEAGSWARFV